MHDFRLLSTLVLATTFLNACSTTPAVSSAQLKQKLSDSHVIVAKIDKPIALTERTKAQALGNMVVSSVAGSVLGSSGSAGNMQQMQSNMQISQAFSQNLNQALPKNYKVGSGHGADLALAKKVSEYFNNDNTSTTVKNQEIYIDVSASLWELGYISMLTSQDYALNYDLNFIIKEKQDKGLKVLTSMHCVGTAKDKMVLDTWKANDYAKVNEAATTIVDKCFNDFIHFAGLPLATTAASTSIKP